MRFEERDFQLVKKLGMLLKPADKPNYRAIAVACHDVGEFVRHHPRGRSILNKLDVKRELMRHMTSADEDVRKQALLCVQKLMIVAN